MRPRAVSAARATAPTARVDFTAGSFTPRVGVRRREAEMNNAAVQGTLPDYFRMGVTNVLGILIGVGLALLFKTVMPTHVPARAPAGGFGVWVGLGVGFGLWPAWKAARLRPVGALRFE